MHITVCVRILKGRGFNTINSSCTCLWKEVKLRGSHVDHVIGFYDPVDLWVIKIKYLWSFARVVRPDHVNRARKVDYAARTCERFVHCITKITRLYDYQTWQTYFEKFTRCAKVCGLFSLTVPFGCWLAQQANPDHVNFSINVSLMFDNHTILLFDFRISKLSYVLAVWSAFLALVTWFWRTTRAKDHGLFYRTHKSTSRKIQSHGMQLSQSAMSS